jgi:hypothetical protein
VHTGDLIERLAAGAPPVRPLAPAWLRTLLWLALALPCVVAVAWAMTPAGDLVSKAADTRFRIEEAAALATAVTAALAAFAMTIPGQSRSICLLPAVPLAIWLASLGQGCLRDWIELGPEGARLRVDWDCLRPALVIGIVPAAAMVTMLRRGAPLFPRTTVALGAMAVGALANAGLQLYHERDLSIMLLVWHFGSVVVLTTIAAWAGPTVLPWRLG